ncbi:hypothetical protein GGR50DRAFT_380711 [Xylaria sp. CBS 124048]|nr:hypothetical protein GGR50DRAFT_380711 [Xylaria sp. CBS 124048]
MMTSATSLQLEAFLAMPAALRSVLLSAFASSKPRFRCIHVRHFSASSGHHGPLKYPNVAAFVIPEFRTSPIVDVAPDDLFKYSSLSFAPGQPLEEELIKLYTKNPATFIHAESDFYKLKKNTRVPEVCVLGRSNVGKSSFVNALAHRPNNGLAFVSSKAGKTKSINAYGFGPAPTAAELKAQSKKYMDEDIPTHTFHLVDMPGYGHASQQEWGRNISLYMSKRNAAQGAIVLIDAEVGPKESDYHLLQLLSYTQLKTAIVLTKADKVKKGLEGLRQTCQKVWDGIHAIEARTTKRNWVWEKDVYVTAVGARDPAVAKSTITTARLAVARLAGLIKDDRPKIDRNQKWSGKMVSFDDLLYAPRKPETNTEATGPGANLPQLPREIPSSPSIALSPASSNAAFSDLDRAAKTQNRGRFRSYNTSSRSRPGYRSKRPYSRRFHSSPIQISEPPLRRLTAEELKAVFKEFVKTLRIDSPRDWVRRLRQERERAPPRFFKTSFQKSIDRQRRKLQRRLPEVTTRSRAVVMRRLRIEERRARAAAYKEAQARAAASWTTWRDAMKEQEASQNGTRNELDEASSARSEPGDSKDR